MLKITLEAARVNARLSQKQVAEALNISNKTIVKWEKGTAYPPIDKLFKLCDLYGVTLDNLRFLPNDSLKGNLSKDYSEDAVTV